MLTYLRKEQQLSGTTSLLSVSYRRSNATPDARESRLKVRQNVHQSATPLESRAVLPLQPHLATSHTAGYCHQVGPRSVSVVVSRRTDPPEHTLTPPQSAPYWRGRTAHRVHRPSPAEVASAAQSHLWTTLGTKDYLGQREVTLCKAADIVKTILRTKMSKNAQPEPGRERFPPLSAKLAYVFHRISLSIHTYVRALLLDSRQVIRTNTCTHTHTNTLVRVTSTYILREPTVELWTPDCGSDFCLNGRFDNFVSPGVITNSYLFTEGYINRLFPRLFSNEACLGYLFVCRVSIAVNR